MTEVIRFCTKVPAKFEVDFKSARHYDTVLEIYMEYVYVFNERLRKKKLYYFKLTNEDAGQLIGYRATTCTCNES